jgi:hypothetical protein
MVTDHTLTVPPSRRQICPILEYVKFQQELHMHMSYCFLVIVFVLFSFLMGLGFEFRASCLQSRSLHHFTLFEQLFSVAERMPLEC